MNPQTQMTTPAPLLNLCAAATKGPYALVPPRCGDKQLHIPQAGIEIDFDDVDHDEALATAEFVSRWNPEVAAKVYANYKTISDHCKLPIRDAIDFDKLKQLADEALNLLDGKTT